MKTVNVNVDVDGNVEVHVHGNDRRPRLITLAGLFAALLAGSAAGAYLAVLTLAEALA